MTKYKYTYIYGEKGIVINPSGLFNAEVSTPNKPITLEQLNEAGELGWRFIMFINSHKNKALLEQKIDD